MPQEQEKEGVVSESPTEQENPVDAGQEQQHDDISPEVGQPPVDDDVDERGVPYRNVAMEYRRKFEETDKKLSAITATLEKQAQGNQQTQYSVEQLEAFAYDSNTLPHDRVWAFQQIEKKRQEDYAKLVEEKLTQTEKQRQNQERQARAVNYVAKNHSDAFLRNENGQFVTDHEGRMQWNPKSQKARLIVQYLQDERLSGQPDALEIAAKMATADLLSSQKPEQQQQIRKLREEKKALERATMTEGGGQAPINIDPIQSSVDGFKQTGRVHDLAQVLKARRKNRQSA